jgi:sulfane dehydrogenase subunit SoxC
MTEITLEELQLAARNHGMPLEALREPVTPVGLHYLLIHYDIPHVDPATWWLAVDGAVRQKLTLDLSELRRRPALEVVATMECAGNGRAQQDPRPVSQPWLLEAVGTGRWGGISLAALLAEAGVDDSAVEVLFTGLDRGIEGEEEQWFQRSLPVAEALRPEVLLAYDLNGGPLPPQHGFPLRLLVPAWYGMTNVKWLSRITVLDTPFTGYQQARGYHLRQDPDEPGQPLSRIYPRSLMVPPGIPDFMSRERTVPQGPCTIEGRAWSGLAPIASVEVSVDDGATWELAELEPSELGEWAWRGFSYEWPANEPGRHVLSCRARDEAGNEQPLEVPWNVGGYANNAVQRVVVNVTASASPQGE